VVAAPDVAMVTGCSHRRLGVGAACVRLRLPVLGAGAGGLSLQLRSLSASCCFCDLQQQQRQRTAIDRVSSLNHCAGLFVRGGEAAKGVAVVLMVFGSFVCLPKVWSSQFERRRPFAIAVQYGYLWPRTLKGDLSPAQSRCLALDFRFEISDLSVFAANWFVFSRKLLGGVDLSGGR